MPPHFAAVHPPGMFDEAQCWRLGTRSNVYSLAVLPRGGVPHSTRQAQQQQLTTTILVAPTQVADTAKITAVHYDAAHTRWRRAEVQFSYIPCTQHDEGGEGRRC